MTIDLTSLLLDAMQKAKHWLENDFDATLTRVATSPQLSIEWDKTVPENWAGIYDSEGINVAVIYVRFPLVITIKAYEELIRKLVKQVILIISVENFDSVTFSIQADAYQQIFPSWESDVIESSKFTISELVYATVT